ncbi:MAG: biotin/lipoyl-containing protein, partial [Planctomycetota bacterium]
MKYFAEVSGQRFECQVEAENGETFVRINGTRYRVDLEHVAATGAYSLLVDGRSFEFALHDHGEDYELAGAAGSFRVRVEDERTRAARDVAATAGGAKGPHKIKSAMPGIVRELRVGVGDPVAKGQTLLILEAMKMQ